MTSFKLSIRSAVLGVVLVATPLIAQDVKTDYDHTATFGNYHTYSFQKVQASDPLFDQRIKDAISKDLNARGWQMVPSGGDIAITAIGATHNQQEYISFYDGLGGGGFGWRRGWGGGGFGETTTTVNQIPIGTLVVDMFDPNSRKLIWRGIATGTLSSKPEKNIEKVDKAVDKMLNKFPPKGAQ